MSPDRAGAQHRARHPLDDSPEVAGVGLTGTEVQVQRPVKRWNVVERRVSGGYVTAGSAWRQVCFMINSYLVYFAVSGARRQLKWRNNVGTSMNR